jgi:hypothetical protein
METLISSSTKRQPHFTECDWKCRVKCSVINVMLLSVLFQLKFVKKNSGGPGSSVGIATD